MATAEAGVEHGGPSADILGFLHGRGFVKTPVTKIDWGQRLKDHDLNQTTTLEPRSRRSALAGRRAKRLTPNGKESKRIEEFGRVHRQAANQELRMLKKAAQFVDTASAQDTTNFTKTAKQEGTPQDDELVEGTVVTWAQANDTVPAGTLGTVTRAELDDRGTVGVKFPAGIYPFKPSDLRVNKEHKLMSPDAESIGEESEASEEEPGGEGSQSERSLSRRRRRRGPGYGGGLIGGNQDAKEQRAVDIVAKRRELRKLKLGVLQKRAKEAGISPEDVDGALVEEEPSDVLIEMLLEKMVGSRQATLVDTLDQKLEYIEKLPVEGAHRGQDALGGRARGGMLGRRGSTGAQSGAGSVSEEAANEALVLLDPSIELTMPGLSADDAQELRSRVLEKISLQVADIQRRILRRRDKMDAMGFIPQNFNQMRAEAMLKLEIRKRVRIEDVKQAVLSEMWRERAAAEPQEGLFANLEAKLLNILDAVGSVETIGAGGGGGGSATMDASAAVDGPKTSKPLHGRGAKSPGRGAVSLKGRRGDKGDSMAAKATQEKEEAMKAATEKANLVAATEEDLLHALRAKREVRSEAASQSASHETIIPGQASKASGPWRELPEWTQRTQRIRQAGGEDSFAESGDRASTADLGGNGATSSEWSGQDLVVPQVVFSVPHMFGDAASLHGGEVQIKGTENVAVPDGHDWLLSSPHGGEDHLLASAPSKKTINAGHQPLDLTADGLLGDDLLGGIMGDGADDLGLDGFDDLGFDSKPAEDAPTAFVDHGPVLDGVDTPPLSSRSGAATPRSKKEAGSGSPAGSVTSAREAATLEPASTAAVEPAIAENPAARRARGKRIREERAAAAAAKAMAEAEAEAEGEAEAAANATVSASTSRAQQTSTAVQQEMAPAAATPGGMSQPLPTDVQRRLETVWAELRMPVMAKLDMAVKYTAVGEARSALLNEALPLWERASSAIRTREQALATLTSSLGSDGVNGGGEQEQTAFAKAKLLSLHGQMHEVSGSALAEMCGKLRRKYGDEVTYEGHAYAERLNDFALRQRIKEIDDYIAKLR